MRRYTITVNGSTKVIDVEAVGADLFRVQLDGHLIDVTLEDHRDLAHSAVTPAITPRAVPSRATSSGAAAPVAVPGAPARPTAAAPVRVPSGGGAGGRNKMTAPMPGVVLSLEKSAGASVQRGDTVLVLEAMKMKNEIRAPRDGVIAEVYVAAGQQVKFGETLVRFEEN